MITKAKENEELDKEQQQEEEGLKKLFFDWILPIIAAVAIGLLINKFLLFKVYIPSESMVPTLKIGDQLFVTKVYNTENIKTGDIVVFYSEELNDLLIKRVIGLPGDKVEIKDNGDVYVNGNKLNEAYVKNKSDKSGSYTVPEGKFFFLGDNRANSKDSRWWNNPYVDKKDIRGKARVRVYPFDRFGVIK